MKTFDLRKTKLILEYENFIDNSNKATIQILYDIGSFDEHDEADEKSKNI